MRGGLSWVCGATVVGVCALAALTYAALGPARIGTGGDLAGHLLTLVPYGLAWLLVLRAPASPVGPAIAWLAALMLATPAVETWGETASSPAPWWGSEVMHVLGAGAWPWQLVGFMAVLLVFPEGLLPGPRWRVVALLVPVSALVVNAAFVLTMNYHEPSPAHSPVAVPRAVWGPVLAAALCFLLAVVVACGTSLVVRYRRGGHQVRQQIRWLVLATIVVVVLMVASWLANTFGWAGPAAYAGFLLGIVVLVPAAVTIAVLRHDLFAIERILSDSVAWLLTTLVAAAVLATAVTSIGYLVGRDTALGLAGAVFVVALGFLPLHTRIHRVVGRVLDRDRTVLVERIGRFVERVRDGSAEPEQVEQVLRDAVGDPGLVLLLTDVSGSGYVGLSGAPATAPPDGVPLRTAEAEIGVVVVSPGSARRARQARVAASAARLPIEVSRLRLGLRRAVDDVAVSRRRLVSAAVDERRRLERDLHDGAQQQLVALGMQLRAVQQRLGPDDPLGTDLDRAVGSVERTVAGLRRLAHGIRPISLDDGLAAALSRLGMDSPVPVEFAVEDVTTSELIATTAYFVVSEALANVLKHAGATRITVSVCARDTDLHVRVTDDGVGGLPAGTPLVALHDRVSSVGGRLEITSTDRSGITIVAVLPCAS